MLHNHARLGVGSRHIPSCRPGALVARRSTHQPRHSQQPCPRQPHHLHQRGASWWQLHVAAGTSKQAAPGTSATFDLPLAIALAATAFEAYLEPTGVDERMQEVLLNNTHVIYTDKAYVMEAFTGLLQLTIHRAKGLKAVNITGGSDPYVIATLGDSSATTAVKWGELDPAWNETHSLYVPRPSKAAGSKPALLRLRVIDKNKLISDVDLGSAMLAVQELLDRPGEKMELQLRGSSNAQGSLTVSAQFLPFSDDLLDAAVTQETKVPDAPDDLLQLGSQLDQAAGQLHEAVAAGMDSVQQAVGPEAAAAVKEQVDKALAEVVKPAVEQAAGAVQSLTTSSSRQQQQQQEAVPVLQKVVQDAKTTAMQTLSGAMDQVEARLETAGLSEQAASVRQSKQRVVDTVSEAADTIETFVQDKGLGGVAATDLSAIIARVAASRLPQALPAPAAADSSSQASSSSTGSSSSTPQLSPEAMPGAWKALASVAGKVIEDVFRPVAFIENRETDTQVWIQLSRELHEVVVAFRGTEQVKWKDFVSDINLIPQTLDVERTGGVDLGISSIPLPFAAFKRNKELMVHSGFLNAYDSVKAKVLRLVDQLTADATSDKPWQIFVTGHSLGGALATLCAYDLAGRKGPSTVGKSVTMYTYGAPRVGNKAFADAFDARLQGRSWRITNTADIVPSVPRLMGYAHVSTGVRVDGSGKLLIDPKGRDVLGEGREVAEVITDLASQALEVAQGNKALEDVVDAIREHEMEILNALIDGSALGQHMEDFYLATLKEAVLAADPALAAQVAEAMEKAAAAAPPPAAAAAAAAAADAAAKSTQAA